MAKYPVRIALSPPRSTAKAPAKVAPKPMPKPKAPAPADTAATLRRAERVQREEAIGDALLMKRGKPDVIRTTVRERATPPKRK